MKTMKVIWLENDSYWQGGSWALALGNGHLFAEMSQKGRNENARKTAQRLADLWNMDAASRRQAA